MDAGEAEIVFDSGENAKKAALFADSKFIGG